ncbi:MAG: PAS domain S-box protein, partial [Deltaproteobacteria bacterium]
MNSRLFSICTPCPEGFIFCSEFRASDFRSAPFALYALSTQTALDFLKTNIERLSGVILAPGEHFNIENLTPRLSSISIAPAMSSYIVDFATHQLMQIQSLIQVEDKKSMLALENERLVTNNQRSSEEFNQFRTSLLREIEERRAAERRLAENEERLRLIMASSGDAIYGMDMDGLCNFANESCLKMFGYSHIGEMLGKNMHYLVHHKTPEGQPIPIEDCRIFKAFRGGVGVTVADEFFWHRDGHCFPVEYSSYPIFKDGHIIGAVVTWRDITKRKQREQKMALMSFAMDNIHEAVYLIDENACFTMVNAESCRALGYERDELLCLKVADVDANFTVDQWPDHWKELKDSRTLNFESCHRDKNGNIFPVDITANYFEFDGAGYNLAIARDIRERKRAEADRDRIEQQFFHAQKLESLGVLAGGIAHDFNNILTSIVGNADLALRRLTAESPVIGNLRKIENAAAQAADLAKQMLAYSGKGKFMVEDINLNRLFEEMLHMLEVSIPKNVSIHLNLAHTVPSVEADVTQIRQIIMNLVINAAEAIGSNSGVINITTGCMECDQVYLKDIWLNEGVAEGLYTFMEISDNGCGMDQETMAKLFDPFFTTKFTGRGLGMAAVLGIIRGHRGAIKVYSAKDKGTSFKIFLPANDRPECILSPNGQNASWSGEGKVLLVDDEETVRNIAEEMLNELGFTTIKAANGIEALDALKSNPDVSFVILDLTMPQMDGEQCFREMIKINSDVKVFMSSGFSEHEVTQKFVGKGLTGFIQKPYELSSL